MKFTLSWLNDHLVTKASLDDILGYMGKAGLEVEHVIDPKKALAPFTVCKVLEAEPHPQADKLRVCKVETIDGVKQIVCGAPNARTGLIGVFAPPGTHVPGTGVDLKPGTIRGVDQTNVYAGGGYAGGGILGMNRAGDVTENTVGSSFRRFGSPNPSMAPVRGTDLTAIYAAGRYEGGGLLGM